jgi:hypothetical protein
LETSPGQTFVSLPCAERETRRKPKPLCAGAMPLMVRFKVSPFFLWFVSSGVRRQIEDLDGPLIHRSVGVETHADGLRFSDGELQAVGHGILLRLRIGVRERIWKRVVIAPMPYSEEIVCQ